MRAFWSRFSVVFFALALAAAAVARGDADAPGVAPPRVAAKSSPNAAAPASETPPDVRSIERIAFTGIAAFALADIREALEYDFDVALAAHPQKDLEAYLGVLRDKVRLGYAHKGFPEAVVEARHDAQKQRIEIEVREGPEYRSSDVVVTGNRHVPVDRIVRELTEHSDPKQIPWKRGKRTAFDPQAVEELGRRVQAAYAAAGCSSARFDIRIHTVPRQGIAKLLVIIREEGPLAIAEDIRVKGAVRDSADDIIRYLAVEPDTPLGSDLPGQLEARLKDSGRYLSVSVNRGPRVAMAKDGVVPHAVEIEVVESRRVPGLFAELSPIEEALLKLADWSARWSRGEVEEDLVIEGELDQEPLNAFAAHRKWDPFPDVRVPVRMVIRPQHGWALNVGAIGGAGERWMDLSLIAQGQRIIVADADRRARVELPDRVDAQALLQLVAETSTDEKHPLAVRFGAGVRTRRPSQGQSLDLEAKLSAGYLLTLLHREETEARLQDGIVEIRETSSELRLEAATGRLIEIRAGKQGESNRLRLFLQARALREEVQRLEALPAAGGRDDPAPPWKSLGLFIIDEWGHVLDRSGNRDKAKSLFVLGKLVRAGSIAPASEKSGSDETDEADAFRVPGRGGNLSIDEFFVRGSNTRRSFAALGYAAWRKFVPPGSRLAPLGRDAILSWAEGDFSSEWELRSAVDAPETGPVTELVLGQLSSVLDFNLTRVAGRAGLKRLSAANFANDYRPLLSPHSPLGRLVLSLAESLRHLDEQELRALARLLPAGMPQERLVPALLVLRTRRGEPVERVLPAVLDRLWTDVLRDYFEAIFLKLSQPESRGTALNERSVRPAFESDRIAR